MSVKAQSNPFSLDSASDVPLGVQLSWRLRALILTGQLNPGERLPSLRRVAGWAGVNVNTVRSVYESLEEQGLIVSQQGRGTFVADDVVPEPELEAVALEALRQAQALGREPKDLAIVMMACASMLDPAGEVVAPLGATAEDSETIEVRQELRRQIARLEAELAAYVRDMPDLYTASPRAKAHVAGVEELEETRDTLIAKLSEAQKAAAERARAEGKARRGKAGGSGEGPLANAKTWWSQ